MRVVEIVFKKVLKCVMFLFITLLCLPLVAQESVEERTSKIEERTEKIEKIVSKLPRISGLVNLRYRYDASDNSNSFDIRRARLDIRGNIVKPLEYRLHIDFANSPKILDAYLNWKINDYIALQAGQYKLLFSLENPYSPYDLEVIENSLVITNLVNYSDVSGISANGRDIGIGLNGNFLRRDGYSIINYSIGVFNGSGINTTDGNKDKDFSGILTIRPIKHLSLAASHYNGSAGKTDSTFQRVRTGFGVKYDDNRLLVRSEYIQGKTGNFRSEGVYAVVAYFVHPKVQVLAKYDYFKRNMSEKNTMQEDYTTGVNYLPVNNICLQFNYIRKSSLQYGTNFFAAQLLVKF